MKKNLTNLFLTILVVSGIIVIFVLDNSKSSDLIQFGILVVTILVMYIPLNKQSKKEQEYQELELGQLSKQLLTIVEYVDLNYSKMDEKFNKDSIVKETTDELKSMISELKWYRIKVLNQANCELVDPSYSKFKLFGIYEIGTDGISKYEYNDGYSYNKFHILDREILTYLRARIKRIK